jgi:hypothetical protein
MRVSQTRRSTAAAVEPTELTLPLAPPAAELYLLYFGWDPAVPSARASAPIISLCTARPHVYSHYATPAGSASTSPLGRARARGRWTVKSLAVGVCVYGEISSKTLYGDLVSKSGQASSRENPRPGRHLALPRTKTHTAAAAAASSRVCGGTSSPLALARARIRLPHLHSTTG